MFLLGWRVGSVSAEKIDWGMAERGDVAGGEVVESVSEPPWCLLLVDQSEWQPCVSGSPPGH